MKCKSCLSDFEPIKRNGIILSRLCISCLVKKNRIEIEKQKKAKKKQEKNNLISHSAYQNLLQIDINKLVRLIDIQYPCIATLKYTGKMNAGHYFAVGSNNSLRFNLHNIHKQSEYSNKYKHGDPIKYLSGIEKRYGKEYSDYLISLPLLYPTSKLTIAEIQEKIKIVRKLIKEHKQEYYSNSEILDIRDNYNTKIGIYDIQFRK